MTATPAPWSVTVGDGQVGILDLPLSIADLVCATAGVGWADLDPHGHPGHLCAVIAGAAAWVAGTPYDDELVAAAALPLRDALALLEVTNGGPV